MTGERIKLNNKNEYFKLCADYAEKSGFERFPSDPNYIAENKKRIEEYFKDKDWLLDILFDVSNSENEFQNYAQSCLFLSSYNDMRNQMIMELTKEKYSKSNYVDILVKYAKYIDFDKYLLSILYTLKIPIDTDEISKNRLLRNDKSIKETFRKTKENMVTESKKLEEYFNAKGHNFVSSSYMDINNVAKTFIRDFYDITGKRKQDNTINKGIINTPVFTDELPRTLFVPDVILMAKDSDCGRSFEEMLGYIEKKYIKTERRNVGNRELNSYLRANISFILKEYSDVINVDSTIQISFYRCLEALKIHTQSLQLSDNSPLYKGITDYITLLTKLKPMVEKIQNYYKEKGIEQKEIPVCEYGDYNAVRLINSELLLEQYKEVIGNVIIQLAKRDESYAYRLLFPCNNTLNINQIEEIMKYVTNKKDFAYWALFTNSYNITSKEFEDLCKKNGINKEDFTMKFIRNQKYIHDDVFKSGFITKAALRKLYDNGSMKIEDVMKFKDMCENNTDALDNRTEDELTFIPRNLATAYKIIYKNDIVKIFKNKEKYSEEDIKNLLIENPEISVVLTDKELKDMKKEFRFQKEYLSKYGTEEDLLKFMDSLGELGLSSQIVRDLFNKKIINEAQAKIMDDTKTVEKYIESKSNERYAHSIETREAMKNPNKILNLYSHKRISEKDLIKLYAKGLISKDLYIELESEKFKGQVDEKHLLSLLDAVKAGGVSYDEIQKYYLECKKYSEDEHFFDKYSEKILSSKKIDKEKLIELGKKGLLTNEVLEYYIQKGNISLVTELIKGTNNLDMETIRFLFRDDVNSQNHFKRDLLENILKTGSLSSNDKFTILFATYLGREGLSKEQIELNKSNLQYFFDNGIMNISYGDDKVPEIGNIRSDSYTKKTKNEQLRIDLLERIEGLFSLDDNSVYNIKGPAMVFDLKTMGKTIVETFGTIKNGRVKTDLTDHRTYIIDTEVFEEYKGSFTEVKDKEEIILFNKLYRWYKDNKGIFDMDIAIHKENWMGNIKTKLGIDNKDKKNKKEFNISINGLNDKLK